MFNDELADRAVYFIEHYLKHTTDRFAGKPFILAPFQKDIVRKIYGTVNDDGTRTYKTVMVSLARKNSKTTLLTALALYEFFCCRIIGAQILAASYTKKQSGIFYEEAVKMIRQNPELLRRCKLDPTPKTIRRPKYGVSFSSISSDPHSHHGFNPSAVFIDEVAELPNMALWNVLTTGSGVRQQPLFFGIGTAGEINHSPVAEMLWDKADKIKKGIFIDPTFLPIIYTLPDGADWKDENNWHYSNPGIEAGFLNVADLRDHFQSALRMPQEEASFRRFKLNTWIQQTHPWIPLHEFDACASPTPFDEAALRELPLWAGVDLSAQHDLTAVACVWIGSDKLYVRHQYFYPADDLKEKSIKTGIPFDQWAKSGFLQTTPGRSVNYDAVFDYIMKLSKTYTVKEVCFDPSMAHSIMDKLSAEGFTVVKVYNSWKQMTPACRELERRVIDRTIVHEAHPITRYCVDCTTVKTDRNENIVIVKPERQKVSKRIDGVSALLSALARIVVVGSVLPKQSVYESRGLIVL